LSAPRAVKILKDASTVGQEYLCGDWLTAPVIPDVHEQLAKLRLCQAATCQLPLGRERNLCRSTPSLNARPERGPQ
jgi:hypothetical protein